MQKRTCDIIIVGGGPVGLYLGIRLIQQGFSCVILEQKEGIDLHSKSMGIHPVSLELFENADILEPFLKYGLKIRKGIAYWNREKAGEIRFDRNAGRFGYILSIPQWRTETILEERLHSFHPGCLIRKAVVDHIQPSGNSVTVTALKNRERISFSARYLVGCDGKNSFVRQQAGIPFSGSSYPDTYLMADVEDNTAFGPDAVVFLHEAGVVESFPLPGQQRRWVVKTDSLLSPPRYAALENLVYKRTGHSVENLRPAMISAFGAQHLLAPRLFSGPLLLAGDAAHVVSPIGGQGMNLGWIGAERCAKTIADTRAAPDKTAGLFSAYSKIQKSVARQVARRAEINMWFGRKENFGFLAKTALRFMTKQPLSRLFADLFTMRRLGNRWI